MLTFFRKNKRTHTGTATLFLIVLIITGCQSRSHKKEASEVTKEQIKPQTTSEYLSGWVNAINHKNKRTIESFYQNNAIKVISPDSVLNTSSQVAEYYTLFNDKIISVESLFHAEAHKDRGIHYEIVKLKTQKSETYIQFVIWKLEEGKKVREFEFTSKSDAEIRKDDKNSITERRNLWIQLCNENNPENLINELYTSNTLYFNHKPLIKGRENLVKEYAYMNNDQYSLTLHPLKLLLVNQNIAYEIGQCKGSYGGKYVLIWKKEADGRWRIFIDSNI